MKFDKVIEIIEKIAPPECGESWDNSGVQVNVGNDDIDKILFCLEINDDIIDEAIEKSVDMIVTHHPLLFNRPDRVDIREVTGRYLIKLIKSGISVYSAHITFDNAPLGNNYYLASLLELDDIEEVEDYCGVSGYLPSVMSFSQALEHVEKSLKLPPHYIRAVGKDPMEISRVALCTGAGGDILYTDTAKECQLIITGDVKLNVAQDAKAMGKALIDAGHYGTEKIFSENFLNQFKELLEDYCEDTVELVSAESDTNPFSV